MKLRHLAATGAAALVMTAVTASPASANLTVCDNLSDVGTVLHSSTTTVPGFGNVEITVGTGETWVAITSGALAGTEIGVDTNPLTVCVLTPFTGSDWYSVQTVTAGGYAGAFVKIIQCVPGPSCSLVLDETGVLVNLTQPASSCIRIAGLEQNPLCTVP